MSKKEFNSMIDFQNILDELEKVSYIHEGERINSNIKEKFETLRDEAIREAKEDLDNIFTQSVMKNVESLNGIPEPLTLKEAEAFEKKRSEAKAKVVLGKNKIAFAKKLLQDIIKEKKSFNMYLSKRKSTKKAAQRFFKENKKEITFEDYQIAREYKRLQNKLEVRSFLKEDD